MFESAYGEESPQVLKARRYLYCNCGLCAFKPRPEWIPLACLCIGKINNGAFHASLSCTAHGWVVRYIVSFSASHQVLPLYKEHIHNNSVIAFNYVLSILLLYFFDQTPQLLFFHCSFLCGYYSRAATIQGWRLLLWKARRHQQQLDKVRTSETVTIARCCQ